MSPVANRIIALSTNHRSVRRQSRKPWNFRYLEQFHESHWIVHYRTAASVIDDSVLSSDLHFH